MSKQVRTLIIAGVAVLALIGLLLGLLFLLPEKGGEESSTTTSSSTITVLDKSTDADGKTVSDPGVKGRYPPGRRVLYRRSGPRKGSFW